MRPDVFTEEWLEEAYKKMGKGGVKGHAKRYGTGNQRKSQETVDGPQRTTSRNLEPVSSLAPSPSFIRQAFFVPGPLPGNNDFLGQNKWIFSSRRDKWKSIIGREIMAQDLQPMGRVRIAWRWVEANKKRDPDNFSSIGKKFILDALVTAGVLQNDGWRHIAGWTDDWEIGVPGVHVTLEEVKL